MESVPQITAEEYWEKLDLMVDMDPLELRDLAFSLYLAIKDVVGHVSHWKTPAHEICAICSNAWPCPMARAQTLVGIATESPSP